MELAALLLNQAQLNNTSNSTTTIATASTPNTPKKQHFNGSSSLASSASSSPQPAGHTDRHRKSSSVVHVRENSLDELEALFDPSKRSSRGQKAQLPPLHKRNLPSSFFSQPKLLRHLHHNRHNNHSGSHSIIAMSSIVSHNSKEEEQCDTNTNSSILGFRWSYDGDDSSHLPVQQQQLSTILLCSITFRYDK